MELWILLPLFSALIMAAVNVVDKFFVLEGEDNLNYKSFCLYSGGMQLVICITMFLLDPFSFKSETFSLSFFYLIFSGMFFGLSLIFLVKAMDLEEISRVEPIYLIHTIIVPMAGLFVLNESLNYSKYLGIILIFISSIFASLRWEGKFSPINKTAISSLLFGGILFAIASVLLKQSVDGSNFSSTQVLSIRALGLFISAGIPMFSLKNISDINRFFKHKARGLTLFIAETLSPLFSMYMIVIALARLDVSVVNSFNGVRPIFAVILSAFLVVMIKKKFTEKLDFQNLFIKVVSGLLAGAGIIFLA